MPKTQTKCPRCQQLTIAQLEQLIDVSTDPDAKQRFLSGMVNTIHCQSCGYSGNIATPIVYHDNEKELLLTYFPAELALPLNEQEKVFGPLITQAVNRLPAEKRKAYLFQPQSFLTYQSLIERIFSADGITSEMLKAQQSKALLIEKLITATSDDVRKNLLTQESELVDAEFFALFSHLMESMIASGQEEAGKQMNAIQELLLRETPYGKQIQGQAVELQEAIKSLQAVGNQLTREKLLEIILQAPNETRISALVSLTRQGLDYEFFQILTTRIEKSPETEKVKLTALREKLLNLVDEIDKRAKEEQTKASGILSKLLESQNLEQSIQEALPEINEAFIQVLNATMSQAKQSQNQTLIDKVQKIAEVIQAASTPPEYQTLQILLEARDDSSLEKLLIENDSLITDEFIQFLASLNAQSEEEKNNSAETDEKQKALIENIKLLYRSVLRYSMKRNL